MSDEAQKNKSVEILSEAAQMRPKSVIVITLDDLGRSTIRSNGNVFEFSYLIKSTEAWLSELILGRMKPQS